MSFETNPFTLGGWSSNVQSARDSFLDFRILHPASQSGLTTAPLDIFNCIILGPHSRICTTISTSFPRQGLLAVPVTSIRNAQGTVVGMVEWHPSNTIVEAKDKVSRQPSSTFIQKVSASTFTLTVDGSHYSWVKGAGDRDISFYRNPEGEPAELVGVLGQDSSTLGGMVFSVSPAILQNGLFDTAALALVVLLAGQGFK